MGAFDPANFDALAQGNPQFANGSPGLAYDAFMSPDPDTAVPALAVAAATTSASDAIQQHADQNGSHGLWGWLGSRVSDIGRLAGDAANLPGVHQALDYLSKPLQDVTDDYKFIHSVYVKHGFPAGFLTTLGVIGAGAVGTVEGGPEVGILAAEGTASVARRLLGDSIYQDSYADSQNPNYQVSLGRDVSNILSKAPGFGGLADTSNGWGKYVSGGLDAIAQFSLDPVIIGGRIHTMVRQGQYLKLAEPADATSVAGLAGTHPLFRRPAVTQFLVQHSARAITSEGMDVVRYGTTVPGADTPPLHNRYNTALKDMANEIRNAPTQAEAAGRIVRNYPYLRGVAADLAKIPTRLADSLSSHGTEDAIHGYLRDTFTAENTYSQIYGPAMLPSRTLMRPLADKIRSGAWKKPADSVDHVIPGQSNGLDQQSMLANQRNLFFPRRTTLASFNDNGRVQLADQRTWLGGAVLSPLAQEGWGTALKQALAKKVRTFTGYGAYSISPTLNDLSGKSFDLLNPEALEGMRRNLYYAFGDREATRLTGEMALMQKAGDLSGLRDLWHSAQVDIVKAAGVPADDNVMVKVLGRVRQIAQPGVSETYSNDHMGNDHSGVLTEDGTKTLAVDPDQTNTRAAFVDYRALHTAMRDLGTLSKVYGRADDFYSTHLINQFFKPLALMTIGFATRIAAAEAIPAAMRYGAPEMLAARVATTAGKMGVRLLPGEAREVAAHALMSQPGLDAHTALLAESTPDHIRQVIDEAKKGSSITYARARIRAAVGPNMVKWGDKLDPEGFDTAVRAALKHEGHVGNDITLAGHLLDYDVRGRSQQQADIVAQKLGAPHAAATGDVNQAYREGDKYGRWQSGNEHFNLYWTLELQKMSQQLAHQQIAQDFLGHLGTGTVDDAWEYATRRESARIAGREYDPNSPDFMGAPLPKGADLRAFERTKLERYRVVRPDGIVGQDPYEFATDRVSRLRGSVTGQDGTFHNHLLEQVSRGEKPTLDQVQSIDDKSSPWFVGGRELTALPGRNLMDRITQYGFKRVVDPIINSLSRQPLYVAAIKREMISLRGAIAKGAINEDDAFNIAELRATHAILPQIHNTALRTQFAMMANSYMPFYFAQEQAVKRTLHLIHDDPSAIRKYQLLYEGISNPAFVNDDGSGNRYVMLPGAGAIGNALTHVASMPILGDILGLGPITTGLPVSVEGSMQSLKTVLPEMQMPGVSPFLSFASQQLAKFNPALERPLSALVGSQAMTGDALDWWIPSSPIRNVVRGLRADETDRAFQNAMLTAIASAYYHGQMPQPGASDAEKQQAIDRIKNNAKSAFMVKALFGMVSPLAPQVSNSDFTAAGDSFTEEFQKMVKSNKGDYNKALQQFLHEHGNAAISYTVAKSTPETRGAYMPYTNKAIDWIEGNQGLVRSQLSTGAAFLIPQANDTSNVNAQAIHDELIKDHLRSRDTPEDFLNAVYVAAGNNLIYPIAKEHADLVKGLEQGGQKDAAAAERTRYNDFLAQMGQANPIWYNDYQSSDKTHMATQALSDLSTILANPDKMGPDFETPQVAAVRDLYNEYVNYKQELLTATNGDVGKTTTIKAAWKSYLTDLQDSQPELAPVIRSVFMRLANATGA